MPPPSQVCMRVKCYHLIYPKLSLDPIMNFQIDFSTVREKIGPFASPEVVQHAPGLPKTRSGKIMRRVLRKVALNDRDVGDTSTLADEGIVEALFTNRPPEANLLQKAA